MSEAGHKEKCGPHRSESGSPPKADIAMEGGSMHIREMKLLEKRQQ